MDRATNHGGTVTGFLIATGYAAIEAEQQRRNADATHAATFVRLQGGDYRVVLSVGQWCALWREGAA